MLGELWLGFLTVIIVIFPVVSFGFVFGFLFISFTRLVNYLQTTNVGDKFSTRRLES